MKNMTKGLAALLVGVFAFGAELSSDIEYDHPIMREMIVIVLNESEDLSSLWNATATGPEKRTLNIKFHDRGVARSVAAGEFNCDHFWTLISLATNSGRAAFRLYGFRTVVFESLRCRP